MPRAQRMESFPAVYWQVLNKVSAEGRYVAAFPSKKLCERAKYKFAALFTTARENGNAEQRGLVAGLSIRIWEEIGNGWKLQIIKQESDGLLELLMNGLVDEVPAEDDCEALLNEHLDLLGSKVKGEEDGI